MFYVYVLKSKTDENWYTGYTNDLERRISEHNKGSTRSTRGREPFDLIYYEASLHEDDAIAREKYLKSGMGKKFLRNRLSNQRDESR